MERYEQSLRALLFAPITTADLRRAAEVWADARRAGHPFAAPDRLDADAILIAQVARLGDPADVAVATTNVRHIGRYVAAAPWQVLRLS